MRTNSPRFDGYSAEMVSQRWPSRVLIGIIRFYQKYVSPLKMGSTCRFEPVCSAYAVEAVTRHGACKGGLLVLARLAKCGPWHPGGFDPVPNRYRWSP